MADTPPARSLLVCAISNSAEFTREAERGRADGVLYELS